MFIILNKIEFKLLNYKGQGEQKMSKKKTLNGIQQSMKQHNAESSNSKTGFNERSNTAKEPGIANTKGL